MHKKVNGKNAALSDEELMSHYQAGDFSAFQTLYERHSGRIHEYLMKRIPSHVAQDLVQDVFEKLHKSREKYNTQYPFLPWLFTISRNTLFDFFKLAETKLSKAQVNASLILDNMPAVATAGSFATHDISTFLSVLPESQRRAIELRYLHEWTFEKIAEDMKTSEDNVRQIMSRAIKKIRSTFKSTEEVE